MRKVSRRQAVENQAGLCVWAALEQAMKNGLTKPRDLALAVTVQLKQDGFTFRQQDPALVKMRQEEARLERVIRPDVLQALRAADEPVLVDERTGATILIGARRKTFRGEIVIVTGWQAPTHAASTGRVSVQAIGTGAEQQFFPGVIGAKFATR